MKKLFLLLMMIVAMAACSDDSSTEGGGGNSGGGNSGNQTPPATLSASSTSVNFATEGGEQGITITSTVEWTASLVNDRADDWCSIDSTSGSAGTSTLTITATANDTPDDRTASVVVEWNKYSKTINVSQKQKDALTVTSSKFEVEAEGGEVEIEVKANIDFEYSIDEEAKTWISYEGTRALQTSTLVFKVAENTNIEKREGKITVKSGAFSEEITIYQAGEEPSIVISQSEYTVLYDGETIAVEVTSNVDVAVEIPYNVNWIKESTTRATSTNTYYFDIAKNEDYDQRSSEIRFTNKENNLSEVVKVTQAQKDAIVVANDTYTVDDAGGTIEIAVGHNVDFDVEISADWITLQTTRAYETETLVFAIAENPDDDSREGTITFISADGTLKQVVKVKQRILVAAEITVEVNPSYNDNLHAQVAKIFGSNVTSITHKSDKTYIITLKKGYSKIPDSAFRVPWLESITIGDGITSIGERAFYNCDALASVTIPDSVTSIGESAFAGCKTLSAFYGKYASEDNRCLIVDGVLNSFAPAELTSYTIPDSVTSIGARAFYECNFLDSVTIGNNVTSIGAGAFYHCNSLDHVTIPDSVTSIGDSAFYYCTSLDSVTIGNSVTSIGEYAFFCCDSFYSVTIPDSVTSIGSYAFSGCYSLNRVYCKPIIPPSLGRYSVFDSTTIYVPSEALADYQSNDRWKYYNVKGYYF